MDVTEISIVHHIGIVIALLWILSSLGCCHTVFYFVFFVYLYLVNERYNLKLRKRLQFEERKQANQRRLLSDSETVRWLNHAVEKVWPICMEQIASQKILLPLVPWFLEKYKPWTASKAVVQKMYLGRNPPMFTEIRVLGQSADDDHLVLELGMNFLSADDMSTILAVKLKKRFGFGIWAKMHVTGMHVEGKVLVGVKFLREWPFLGRLRVCFVEPPYFQMTVKPIFNHGLDVAELPGIAGWLDKILSVAFGQTLVEPNMLVVDVEKFVSAPTESWFSVDEKRPIAFAKVEIVEAADMKPSDPNGLADPYVKGQLGPYRFRTKTQKKTLTPKWQEEYKIPICSWESPNVLVLEVRDKDHFLDDTLGDCSIDINNLRGEKRHDMWLPLQNIKMGRLRLAITVLEANTKVGERASDEEPSDKKENVHSKVNEASQQDSKSTSPSQQALKTADKFEPIDVEGQQQTGIWVHHPGSDICQKWEPRKGKIRRHETQLYSENDDSIASTGLVASDRINHENAEGNQVDSLGNGMVQRSIRKISSIFQKSPRSKEPDSMRGVIPSPRVNLRPVDEKVIGIKLVVDGNNLGTVIDQKAEESSTESPAGKRNKKGMRMGILKSAHKIKHVLSKKGSDKSKGSPRSSSSIAFGDREMSRGSSSSDRESLASSKEYSPKVVPPTDDSGHPIGEFPSAKEQNPSEESLLRKVSLQGVVRTDEEQAVQVEVVEGSSSSPKVCDCEGGGGDLEVDKE